MSDKAFLMEAINDWLETYAKKRMSVIQHKSVEMTDTQLRDEVARFRAAKEIQSGLTQTFR